MKNFIVILIVLLAFELKSQTSKIIAENAVIYVEENQIQIEREGNINLCYTGKFVTSTYFEDTSKYQIFFRPNRIDIVKDNKRVHTLYPEED